MSTMDGPKSFCQGDRVVILKDPPGGYPAGFVPPVFTGTVTGLLTILDENQAIFQALMAEYPDRELNDLPWVRVSPAQHIGPGMAALTFEGDIPVDEVARLLAAHPFYVVDVDGHGDGIYRPDELEPARV